jgi:hypothetical protein
MKQWTTIVSIVVAVAVLAAAWGIGLYIRQARLKRAETASSVRTDPTIRPRPDVPMPGPGGPGRSSGLSADERARLREQRARTIEQMGDMSEEEKERFRAQVRQQFDAGRQGGRRGFAELSEEERARIREQFESMRTRWENMSEQERQEFMAQMREGFGGQRGGQRPAMPGPIPDPNEKPTPEPEEKKTGEDVQDTSPENSNSSETE